MGRPGVLHVVRDWVRPSEGFVAGVVLGATLTRSAVAFGQPCSVPEGRVPAYDLARFAARGDRPLRLALALVATRQRSDVVHAHFGYWAAHAEALARRTRRPWGVSLHGQDLLVEGCPVAAGADLVVVPSRFLADAASRAGVRDEVLRVIPSGVDTSKHPFRVRERRPGPVVVTFIGRYVEKKGALDAARALAGVDGIAVRFVGHGPLEAELRRVLQELGVDAELVDGSAPGAVRDALHDTDLALTASKVAADGDAETLGLVNLEALASGVPLVTTTSGGIPEAVPPSAAILVAESDVEGLRDAVRALVEHPERWPAMGRAGRAHVERCFSLPDRVAEIEQHWVALANRTPLPEPQR